MNNNKKRKLSQGSKDGSNNSTLTEPTGHTSIYEEYFQGLSLFADRDMRNQTNQTSQTNQDQNLEELLDTTIDKVYQISSELEKLKNTLTHHKTNRIRARIENNRSKVKSKSLSLGRSIDEDRKTINDYPSEKYHVSELCYTFPRSTHCLFYADKNEISYDDFLEVVKELRSEVWSHNCSY
jgi:hypothetical protein